MVYDIPQPQSKRGRKKLGRVPIELDEYMKTSLESIERWAAELATIPKGESP